MFQHAAFVFVGLLALACGTFLIGCTESSLPATGVENEETARDPAAAKPEQQRIEPGEEFVPLTPEGVMTNAVPAVESPRAARYVVHETSRSAEIELFELPVAGAGSSGLGSPWDGETGAFPGTEGDAGAPSRRSLRAPVSGFESTDFDDNIGTTGGFIFIPPDSHAAAGPDHVVNVVNVTVSFHTKDGTQVFESSLASFFATLAPTTFTFDPKVIYDQVEDRFLIVTLEHTDAPNVSRIFLAVSDDANPLGSWTMVELPGEVVVGFWADYPGFAIDEEAVYITNNLFPFGGGAFVGSRLWVVDKGVSGGFYDDMAASFGVFNPYGGAGAATTTQPAHVFGSVPAGVGTFLASYSGLTGGGTEFVQVVRMDDPLGSPTFTQQFLALGDIEPLLGGLPDAPQLGSASLIETNDRRALNAVWRDGSLWISTTVDPGTSEATAYWLELDTSAIPGSVSLADQGAIAGEDIAAGTFTFFPSIAVNSDGDVGIGFSASASTIFAGSYFTRREPGDPAGTTQGSELLRAGTDFYLRTFGGPSNRWGDYSGIAVDPEDECFWAYNQHAIARGTGAPPEDGRWGTAYGRFCPCAQSQSLIAGQWKLISMPCNAGGANTVAEVFGDDLGMADFNLTWAVFERDEANQQYVQLMNGTDVLTEGEGYWVETLDVGRTVDVEGRFNPVIDTSLVSEATEGRLNMVGHPFDFKVCWADVQVVDGGSPLTLAQADPAIGMTRACLMDPPDASCVMSRIAYKWNGAAYQVFDGETLGAEGELESFDGLWVRAFKSGIALRVPATESSSCGGSSPAPIAPQAPQAQPGWTVRLIAQAAHPGTAPLAARALRDAGNVLGQLPDSEPGYDRHDLEEPAPFAAPFLTVVFPHDDWGASSGVYTTDFHPLDPQQPDAWRFEVQASADVGRVTLTWEGSEAVLRGAELLDEATGRRFAIKPGGSFSFEIAGASRSFRWLFPGSPGDGGGVPSL